MKYKRKLRKINITIIIKLEDKQYRNNKIYSIINYILYNTEIIR